MVRSAASRVSNHEEGTTHPSRRDKRSLLRMRTAIVPPEVPA
jgi:hypothetical protein